MTLTARIARAALVAALIATPTIGQDVDPPAGTDELREGADLLRDGASQLLRGLLDDMEPAMRDLAETLDGWKIEGFSIRDLDDYQPPEMLPNGDIILRRKTPLERPLDEGEIEL